MTTTTTPRPARVLDQHEAGPDVLSRERYVSQEYLALEYERLWPRVWQLACRADEIPNVGDFLEYRIGNDSLLVLRSEPDHIRAFHNTCLHRGTRLKEGCGNARELRCPYHAWRWALDGRILEVPDREDFRKDLVQEETLRLPEARVELFAGFVFVHFDPEAPPLHEYLDPMPRLLETFRMDEMHTAYRLTAVLPANWKVVLESFAEGYHVQGTHAQMLAYFDDTSYVYEPYDTGHAWYWVAKADAIARPSPRIGVEDFDRRELLLARAQDFADQGLFTRKDLANVEEMCREELPEDADIAGILAGLKRSRFDKMGIDLSRFSDADLLEGKDIHIFPNLVGPIQPGVASVFRVLPNGDDPHSSIYDMFTMMPVARGAKPFIRRDVAEDYASFPGWGSILKQDMHNIPRIQAGLRSRPGEPVRFGAQEIIIKNFHRMLDRYVGR